MIGTLIFALLHSLFFAPQGLPLGGIPVSGGGGSITFVNSVTGDNGSTTSPTVVTGAASLTAANTMICGVRLGSNTTTVSGITDTAGNTYIQVPGAKNSTASGTDIWQSFNVTGNAANTVTVTTSGTNQYQAAICIQIHGLRTTNPFDVAANGGTGSSVTTITSGSFTPAAGGELIVWAADQTIGGGSWSGAMNGINSGAADFELSYNTSGASGAQTVALTYSIASGMDISVGAFKP